uniref:NADH dehydrogenase [ubiquinone] flavoprotein 3, mitochondrial n=2 Tax=Electrophorus electricus TaxID=8005 RepID=A0AAY5EAC5_ELEEL
MPTATSKESPSVKTTEAVHEHVTAESVTMKRKAPEASAKGALKITKASLAAAHQESVDTTSAKSAAIGKKEPGVQVKTSEVKAEPVLEPSQGSAAMKETPKASTKVTDHLPQTVTKRSPEANLKATPDVLPDSAKAEVSEAKIEAALQTGTVAEAVAKVGTEASRADELIDSAPIITDKAQAPAEPEAVAAPEEPVPPPEPESFDNTTYKNLQHHSYHMFTFSDMDVELAKHRLPQPSTGRPSPMH